MSRPAVDVNSPEFVADPYPVYRALQANAAPTWLPHSGPTGGMWLVVRYQDVAALLTEANTSKNHIPYTPPEQVTPFDYNLLAKDPPDHTRLRGLAAQAFTPARVRDLAPRIAAIVDELIARVRGQAGMEFMSDFALPLPVIVIAELLGVPPEDRDAFHAWSNQIVTGIDALRQDADSAQAAQTATMSLSDYFTRLIALRRQQPREDLISALIAARDAQDRLGEQELIALCMLLLIAGHETTVNLFGNGLLTLLRHRDSFEQIKANPDLLPPAIEEILRYESPVQRATFRIATEPLEIGGATIAAGQQVSAVIGAANRDPNQFPHPDTFDITRKPNRHLAFGLGIHFCLGAPLARTEAAIGFARLLAQLPNLQLVDATPDWNPNTFFRGLRSLPVTF